MKVNVVDALFQLKIGNERVAVQNNLFTGKNYFDNHICFSGIKFHEDIFPANFRQEYMNSNLYTKFAKEQLGTSVMLVAAFHNLFSTPSS